MSIAQSIRDYALRSVQSRIARSESMSSLEHCLVESFLGPLDWETHMLWSVEWCTFALIVAESLDNDSKRERRYKAALVWALGAGGEFPARKEGQGPYWWRMELQARAGLEWDGKRFIPGEVGWMVRPERLRGSSVAGVPPVSQASDGIRNEGGE